MNASLIRLTIRTAHLIQSYCESDGKPASSSPIQTYFRKMGSSAEEIKSVLLGRPGNKQGGRSEQHRMDDLLSTRDEICTEINSTLTRLEKIFMLLLMQDCMMYAADLDAYRKLLEDIYHQLAINTDLIDKFKEFLRMDGPQELDSKEFLILGPPQESTDEKLEGSWIESNAPRNQQTQNLLEIDKVSDQLIIMFVDQIKSFIVRWRDASKNKFDLEDGLKSRFRILHPGSELSLPKGSMLTYTKIKEQYLRLHPKGTISLVAKDVTYKSLHGTKEVRRFTTSEVSGQLIGIVGKEGVGKSTLLKLLAGQFKSDSGRIIVNGYDLWRYKYLLKGIIGYVPEEDLLIEELTVFENLALTARLHYSGLGKKEIEKKVDTWLVKLDLYELKHEVVGDIFKKHIQPGQRRMLNIAMELLREPNILLVDNALYGLSMADASKVIKILHDYSFDGNLVITTISQASSLTFSYFDKIWILDEGGRLVFNGTIRRAASYLLEKLNLAYRNIQHIDPSVLLDLINYKMPDPEGGIMIRVNPPEKWHELYCKDMLPVALEQQEKTKLPARILRIPNLEVQLLIFSIRNFKSKFHRKRDILSAFLAGPLIGLVLAVIMRMQVDGAYAFVANDNLPFFQFISVIIAVFMGMIASADEFTKERNLLKKEEYLEFSRFSYINSKILYLFPLIAAQIFLYIIVTNTVLEIKGMLWYYWIVLFSAGCFGVLMGLFLSMSVRHVTVIYKTLIPVILALQILLGGGIIPYENLNIGKGKYAPVVSDLMVSRWGYEALAVTQFKNNKYEALFFDTEKELSQASFHSSELLPALEDIFYRCVALEDDADSLAIYCNMLQDELTDIEGITDVYPFEFLERIQEMKKDSMIQEEIRGYLTYLSIYFYNEYNRISQEKEDLLVHLQDSLGMDGLEQLRSSYYNAKLEEIVRQMGQEQSYRIFNHEIIPETDIVFMEPESEYGRAGFFSSTKLINGQYTNTLWFNTSVIWLLTFLLYLLLLFDMTNVLRKGLHREPV